MSDPASPRPRTFTAPVSWALAVSLALHAALLFPPHWAFGVDLQPAAQIYMQASLQPPAPVARKDPAKPRSAKPGKKTAAGNSREANSRLIVPGQPDTPAASSSGSENQPEESIVEDAYRLDMPQPPDYPADALARKLEGCVLALVTVSASGAVSDVKILETDHPGVFDQTVIDSQKDARYLAAHRGDEAVASRVLAVAAFVLDPARRMNCALKYAPSAEKLVGKGAPQ